MLSKAKLSKSEYKYRVKLIQEYHMKKHEQQSLDRIVCSWGGYKNFYYFKKRRKRITRLPSELEYGNTGAADLWWLRNEICGEHIWPEPYRFRTIESFNEELKRGPSYERDRSVCIGFCI